jgi:hypothetical protein
MNQNTQTDYIVQSAEFKNWATAILDIASRLESGEITVNFAEKMFLLETGKLTTLATWKL